MNPVIRTYVGKLRNTGVSFLSLGKVVQRLINLVVYMTMLEDRVTEFRFKLVNLSLLFQVG